MKRDDSKMVFGSIRADIKFLIAVSIYPARDTSRIIKRGSITVHFSLGVIAIPR